MPPMTSCRYQTIRLSDRIAPVMAESETRIAKNTYYLNEPRITNRGVIGLQYWPIHGHMRAPVRITVACQRAVFCRTLFSVCDVRAFL